MDRRAALARRFHELHRGKWPLVLMNAWDGGSARVFVAAGCPAVATTSGGIAFSLGHADGELLAREELIEATARIAAAVGVPVTADVESGYGATPEAVGETIALVLEAGAIGVNLEDTVRVEGDAADGDGGAADGVAARWTLRDLDDQCARLRAARAAADATGVPLFLNARTDTYLLGAGEPGEERLALAIGRLRAYAEAGADGIFVPGMSDPAEIAATVAAVDRPLNLLASPTLQPVGELARLGVARVSVGSGPARAALALTRRIADEVNGHGTYDLLTDHDLPYDAANRLFG